MIILKKLSLVLISLTAILSSSFGQKLSRTEYINKYKDIAIKQMISHGVPASIILAQACLESGDGNSRLALEGNNHFGIKCNNWTGATIHHDDDEKGECFRKYESAEESFNDHSKFLKSRDRYKFLFDLDSKDYKAWSYGLKSAGYATNPKYPELLIKIIEDFNLTQYDYFEQPKIVETPPAVPATPKNPIESSKLYKFSLSRQVFENNSTSYIITNENDTYENIARDFQLFKKELLRFNDLNVENTLKAGVIIYIEKKKRKYNSSLHDHIVNDGDKMYFISQKYAIRLKNLYKLNKMSPAEEPVPGQLIKLN